MDTRNEIERIARNNDLESMPANPWEFDIHADGQPAAVLERVSSLLSQIAKFDSSAWPADSHWREVLPGWMKARLPDLTKEESDHLMRTTPREKWDQLPWEFGSWLDAVRDRGWRWWGYSINGEAATVVLHIAMYPERIDAFREILHASGATITAERYSALADR